MSDPERALQEAIATACLGDAVAASFATDLRAFLERHGVDAADVDAILAAPPRLGVYRSLVRNGLSLVVSRVLRSARQRMNASCAGRFDADFALFIADIGPRTHSLRDVPSEFVAWAQPRWRADPAIPAYLSDLATHEIAAFVVASCADARPDVTPTPGDLSLHRAFVFHGSARLLRYQWAVHELSGEDTPLDATPAQRDVALLAYRDREHAVRWLELTPLAASIVERLLADRALGDAVADGCAAHGTAPPAVASDVARLLADLAGRGVIVGTRERAD